MKISLLLCIWICRAAFNKKKKTHREQWAGWVNDDDEIEHRELLRWKKREGRSKHNIVYMFLHLHLLLSIFFISSYSLPSISYMCLMFSPFSPVSLKLNMKWTKFSQLGILLRSFSSTLAALRRRRRRRCPSLSSSYAIYVEMYTFLGCLVFGYFEAHIGRSFEHKLNVAEGMRKGKIIFMCTWHLETYPPSSFLSAHIARKFSTPWNFTICYCHC